MFGTSQWLKADLILLGVALLWGGAFAAKRAAAIQTKLFLFNALGFC